MKNKPSLIILSGPSGSGKSTTAKKLLESLEGNPAYLSLDSIKHFVKDAKSTDYFLDLARINAVFLTENYLRGGHSVIVEKAFGCYDYVKPFINSSNDLGFKSHYFKIVAPLNILIERVERRRNYSLQEKIEVGEWPLPRGNKKTAIEIYNFFEAHAHEEGIEIDSSKNSIEEIVQIIRSQMNS